MNRSRMKFTELDFPVRPGLDAMYFMRPGLMTWDPWINHGSTMDSTLRPLPELVESILADFKTATALQHRQAEN